MKLSFLFQLKFVVLLASVLISLATFGKRVEKPAVIITQDGEVDDRSSFVRFLLYTPDMDVRGIVATNSKWQKNGHGLNWIYEAYDLYGQVRENLLLHNPDYPTVEFLKSITVLGNENPDHLTGGAPYVDSEGSELILRELLKIEDKLLHINCWGGANTVAQALWKFRKNYPDEYKNNISKVRVIAISFQDEAGDWIVNNMPEVRIIKNNAFHMTWNYHNEEPLKHNPYPLLMSEKWLTDNVKTNHGPLGAWYPQKNISEGDTPAFLDFVNNGLKAYTDYSLGGWGGRYQSVSGNYWSDATDDNNMQKTLWRWIPAVQNDFEARMDWCIKSFEEANHPPVVEEVTVPGTVKAGQKVELKASASDADGDEVYYWWWHYPDPSGMNNHIKIVHETSDNAHFTVPENSDKDIHIILEVSDDGSPVLKKYKRLIFRREE